MEGTMKRVLIISLALVFAAAGFAYAQTDFTGTWVLDFAKSDMGTGSAAGKRTPVRPVVIVIKQTTNLLTIERSAGNRKETAVYKLDGSESINTLPSSAEARTRMKWAGDTLVAKTTSNVGGMNTEMTDLRSLDASGRVMTVKVARTTPRGVVNSTLIYNKQQ
jgi:hypothetical protein